MKQVFLVHSCGIKYGPFPWVDETEKYLCDRVVVSNYEIVTYCFEHLGFKIEPAEPEEITITRLDLKNILTRFSGNSAQCIYDDEFGELWKKLVEASR